MTSPRSESRDNLVAEYLSALIEEKLRVVSMEQIEGGFSRHTHRAVCETQSGERRTFALRAEAEGGLLETDLAREFKIVRALYKKDFRLPPVLGFETSGEVLGQRFITTEWARGSVVNPWRTRVYDDEAQREQLCLSWITDIASLHSMDVEVLRASGVDVEINASRFVNAQVEYWVERIRRSDHHPGPLAEMLCSWLEIELPDGAQTTIVHGDLRLGNMLVDAGRVSVFLDWEMAGVGDWRSDIGYTLLPYHAGKLLAPIPPSCNGLIHPRRFLELYLSTSGFLLSDEEAVYFMVLGCVKLISILCTGIDSYMSERSLDPRLVWLNIAVPGLVQDALDLIEKGLTW